jgi:hypothetical protein
VAHSWRVSRTECRYLEGRIHRTSAPTLSIRSDVADSSRKDVVQEVVMGKITAMRAGKKKKEERRGFDRKRNSWQYNPFIGSVLGSRKDPVGFSFPSSPFFALGVKEHQYYTSHQRENFALTRENKS